MDFTFRNITAVFALAGLVFYAVGIVQRLAVLNAEHIPAAKGLPLLSLQNYLVEGLATVLSPRALGVIFIFGLLVVVILLSAVFRGSQRGLREQIEGSRSDGSEAVAGSSSAAQVQDDAPTARADESLLTSVQALLSVGMERMLLALGLASSAAGLLFILAMIVETAIFVPLARWGPYVAALVPLAVIWILKRGRLLELPPWSSWQRTHARVVAITLLVMLTTFALVKVWYVPAPLDRVSIRTVAGAKVGPTGLLGNGDGFVYVLSHSRQMGQNAAVSALPVGRIASMTQTKGPPRVYKTALQLAGVTSGFAKQRFHGAITVRWCTWFVGVVKTLCRSEFS